MKSWYPKTKKLLLIGGCLLVLPLVAPAADPAASPSPSLSPSAVPEHIATDEEIRTTIIRGILANPNVFAADLRVEVQDGAVTLDGTVRDTAAKKTVEEIARGASGTHEVTNRLRPRESQ